MSNHTRRLRALEHARLRRSLTEAGQPYGLSADDLLDEARQFFALPLAAQLAEIESIMPQLRQQGFTDTDLVDMRALLIREYRPMTTL
jgi:hypothetical protein